MGARLGIDLLSDPDRILEPALGADSAVIGMSEGLYTGRKLSDYRFPSCLNASPAMHPRRIVNGYDGTDRKISRYHHAFHRALLEAGWAEGGDGQLRQERSHACQGRPDGSADPSKPAPKPLPTREPLLSQNPPGFRAWLISVIAKAFG